VSRSRDRVFEIEGKHLVYPTEFRDGCSAAGLFLVKSAVANEYIADSGFEVAEVAPGRGILVLTGVRYTDSDCGKYDETAMALFVKKVGRKPRLQYASTWIDIIRGQMPTFTWNLQVTTPLSRDAGIFMWGLPKTIEDITFENAGGRAVFNLRMDGREVFNYSVQSKGSTTPAPVTSPVYSIWEPGRRPPPPRRSPARRQAARARPPATATSGDLGRAPHIQHERPRKTLNDVEN
jgi:hypothetical protein